MPRASYGDRHCLTIQQDKEHVTLDFTSRVIDFFTVHNMDNDKGKNPSRYKSFHFYSVLDLKCPAFCLPALRVWRPIGSRCASGGGAGCDWPADPRLALAAHSLPRSPSLVSYHVLLSRHKRLHQAVGAADQRRQSTTEPAPHTQSENSQRNVYQPKSGLVCKSV